MQDMNLETLREEWMRGYQPDQGIRARVADVLRYLRVDEKHLDRCLERTYGLATQPFARDGAFELVSALQESDNEVVIWTQGDPEYQQAKLLTFFTPEQYDSLSHIISARKLDDLESHLALTQAAGAVVIDDKIRYLQGAKDLARRVRPDMAITTVRSIDTMMSTESQSFMPDIQVKGPAHLLQQRDVYPEVFSPGQIVYLDFDRTLFDPDRFVREALLPEIVRFAGEV
jgi:hypothetical protein